MPRPGTDQPPLPGLSPADLFVGFGPTTFRCPLDTASGYGVRARKAAKLMEAVKTDAPRTPGVYGMIGSKGKLVYVGKAKNLRSRLLSYFRENSRHPKAGKIIRHTHVLVWEHAADEFAALLRELELIRRFRPRFNVLGQPDGRRSVYLCLGRPPAAFAYVTREPTGKELAAYGPFVGRRHSQDVVRRFNMAFKLRDCPVGMPMGFADQPELFDADRSPKCLRFELNTCLGPCAGLCTRTEYSGQVKAAKAFLDGKDRTAIDAAAEQMKAAAAGFRYEQAAAHRDRHTALAWLFDRLTFLRTARATTSFVYPLAGADGLTRWYLIHGGEVRAVVREPGCTDTAGRASAAVDATFANRFTTNGAFERCMDGVLIVTGWFRKRADEKAALLTHKAAEARCAAFVSQAG